ncbi:MAG: LemA family protein [Phycisphaeraceae bacterium]|nr:LemA family protein [Phycisphaeraceae bacterium]
MEPLLVALVVVAAALLLPGVWFIATYNRFVRLRQHIRESWSGIDVELKRRYDLIPNLVETVRGYARHERETLELVTRLRDQAMIPHGSASEQAVDESALSLGLKRLFALAEAYPALKADTQYLALQKELANTEDRIAAARRFFNANVRELNQLRETFPTNLVGGMMSVAPASFFELSSEAERVVPRVSA